MRNKETHGEWTVNGRDFKFYHEDYNIGCGGFEVPMPWDGKYYLYVWNKEKSQHEYFCFEDDLFMGYEDAPWIEITDLVEESNSFLKPDVIAES